MGSEMCIRDRPDCGTATMSEPVVRHGTPPGAASGDVPEVPAPKKKATSGTKPKRAKVLSVDTPSLFETIRRELEPEATDTSAATGADPADEAIDPDETQAIPWSPSLSKTPLADDPDAPRRGRLLGRAFGDPQEKQ